MKIIRFSLNAGAFNFNEFETKEIQLNDIFSNNPNFLSKLENEKKCLKASLETFGSFENKPNFDLILKKNKHNKLSEYILILHNEKNLM